MNFDGPRLVARRTPAWPRRRLSSVR